MARSNWPRNPDGNATPHGKSIRDDSVHIPLPGSVGNQVHTDTRTVPVTDGSAYPGPPSSGMDEISPGPPGSASFNQVRTSGSGNRGVGGGDGVVRPSRTRGYAGQKADLPKAPRPPDWTKGAKAKNVPAPQARRRGV